MRRASHIVACGAPFRGSILCARELSTHSVHRGLEPTNKQASKHAKQTEFTRTRAVTQPHGVTPPLPPRHRRRCQSSAYSSARGHRRAAPPMQRWLRTGASSSSQAECTTRRSACASRSQQHQGRLNPREEVGVRVCLRASGWRWGGRAVTQRRPVQRKLVLFADYRWQIAAKECSSWSNVWDVNNSSCHLYLRMILRVPAAAFGEASKASICKGHFVIRWYGDPSSPVKCSSGVSERGVIELSPLACAMHVLTNKVVVCCTFSAQSHRRLRRLRRLRRRPRPR